MAYHHFPSVEQVTCDIVKYLKPRGMAVANIAARAHDAAAATADGVGVNESKGEGKAPPIVPAEYKHLVSHTWIHRGVYACVIRGCRTCRLHLRTIHVSQVAWTRSQFLPRYGHQACAVVARSEKKKQDNELQRVLFFSTPIVSTYCIALLVRL
jgi:hypothetical protein